MAKKTKDDEPKERVKDKELLLELRERYKKCVDADRKNRDKYRENMRFTLVPGEQWDAVSKKERGQDRVMYEFNEVRIKCKAVVNQIRSNRPSAKISAAEDGDVELAEAMKGFIDQIQNASDADSVMDYATEHQVIGGMGAERYITQYCDDSVDKQEICIEPIKNPMCLYADYASQKQDKSDARFWILASKLSKEVYKARYPKAEPVEFAVEDEFDDDCDDDHVWVAEYWKQLPVTRTIALLTNGKTVDMEGVTLPPDVQVVKTRKVPGHKIVQYICSGDAVLTDEDGVREHQWAGKEFPFNIVFGEYAVIDGKEVWYGLPEHGKDAQRAHNWAATSVYEAIATTPQGTTWVTEVQAANLTNEWNEAIKKNIRVKRYNFDARSPGPPVSEPPASIPTALVSAMQMSSDSLKAVLGMPDSTLGEQGAENSGVAIRRRQEAGAVANYNFGDNMTKFARRRHEILIDLIPKVYDTAREIRVLGKDGAEKWIRVNTIDPVTGEVINDLSAPKFDLVVTQGPNFATQRQEAVDAYTNFASTDPLLMASAGDLVYGAMDLPHAQEIAERRKAMLPPQVLAVLNKDKPMAPEVVAAMQQVEQQAAILQEQAAVVQEETATAQSDKAAADKAKADLQIAAANLKVQEAQLATDVANFQKMVAEAQLKLIQQQTAESETASADEKAQSTEEISALAEGIALGLEAIQQANQQMLQSATEQLAQLIVTPKPQEQKSAVTRRVNGKLVTEVSDGRVMVSERGPDGGLVTTLQPSGTVQ